MQPTSGRTPPLAPSASRGKEAQPAGQNSFALKKDMSVNKMYAKYLERFGSASVPTLEGANAAQPKPEAALQNLAVNS